MGWRIWVTTYVTNINNPRFLLQICLYLPIMLDGNLAKLAKSFRVNMLGNSLKPADAVRNVWCMVQCWYALVSSRLVYCNSLFRSLSSHNIRKLQTIQIFVQNSLAEVVTKTTKYTHISPVCKMLHWLTIEYRCVLRQRYLCTNSFTVVLLMPPDVRSQQSVGSLETKLKTYLFRLAYPPP